MTVSRLSRYRDCPVVDVRGRSSLALRRATVSAEEAECTRHVLIKGETLDLLAWRYYGREDLWWLIADVNRRTDRVFPWDWEAGDVVLVPPLRSVGSGGRG